MKGITPCPYCGGEIEMVKLAKKAHENVQPYRIECRQCRALVAHGQGFPVETLSEAEERIKKYNEYLTKKSLPHGWGHKKIVGSTTYNE